MAGQLLPDGTVQYLVRLIASYFWRSTSSGGLAPARQFSGVPSSFAIRTAAGTVFTLAAGEIGFIQNLSTDALAVKKGATASTTSLSFILPGGAGASDGSGGATKIDDWAGVVSVASMTGGALSYVAWKQAP